VPPSGTWEQRRADLYGLAEQWTKPAQHTEAAALQHLVRRYLAAFGPAAVTHIADWAGIPAGKIAPIVKTMSLRKFRDEEGKELVDVPRAPLPDAAVKAPVRFLPTWDATLLVHARRTQILPEALRPRVFNTKTPHSVPTFLVDGVVAGTWRLDDHRIQVQPFDKLSVKLQREVKAEAERLTAFHSNG
jgi:hypothetical protein